MTRWVTDVSGQPAGDKSAELKAIEQRRLEVIQSFSYMLIRVLKYTFYRRHKPILKRELTHRSNAQQ